MVHGLVEIFLSIPAPIAIGAVFLFTAAETALFLGFLVPGELIVILGGVLASRGRVPLTGVLLAGVLGPVTGDSIGYFVGEHYRGRFSHGKRRWARARVWLRTRGASAVFLGRFTAFLRSVIPAAAGVASVPYRRFLVWDVAASILWGAGSALLGYFVGRKFESISRWVGYFSFLLLLLIAAAVAFSLTRQKAGRRSSRRKSRASSVRRRA